MSLDGPPVDATATSASLCACRAQLTQQLDAYYDHTRLLAVLQNVVRSLTQRFATRRLVPLNPYVALLAHIRQAEISAHELLIQPRDPKTLASQELLLFDPQDNTHKKPLTLENQIATFQILISAPPLAVWATRAVVERIPYSSDWQFGADSVFNLFSMWLRESESVDEQYQVASVGAAVGPNVFFFGANRVRLIELERHIVVTGDQLESAMAVFARQQTRSLFEATKKSVVLPLADGGLTRSFRSHRSNTMRSKRSRQADLQLIGPLGDLVTTVELHDLQTFQQLVVEATAKQCVLQIVLPPVLQTDQVSSSEPIVRLVTKTYVFRYSSPEPSAAESHAPSSICDAFQRRLHTFGVAFAVETTQTTWHGTDTPSISEHDYGALTAFAARASHRNDSLLLDHLRRLTASSKHSVHSLGSTSLLLRLLDMERVLEWLLHRLVFQQQTSLTPRSEASALAAEAKTILTHVAAAIERIVVPRVEAMGMVDVRRVVEATTQTRSFCVEGSTGSDSDHAAVATAERWTRRL